MAITDKWKNARQVVSVTIYEKVCPVCGNYVEVYPDLGWEIEWHEQRHYNGAIGKCPAVGTRLPEGNARQKIAVRIRKYKGE